MRKYKKVYLILTILSFVLIVGCQNEKATIKTQKEKSETKQENTTEQIKVTDDKKIEEALRKYRKARSDQKDSVQDGLFIAKDVEGGAEAYGLAEASEDHNELDGKEVAEGFQTAQDYVDQTLKLDSEVYECADPRILQIYDDDDKGVAKGYDKDDIFVLEYEEKDKTWSYLFLGKEGKGKPWKVLAHGKSYK